MDFNNQEKLHRNLKNGKNPHRHMRREEDKRRRQKRPKVSLGHEETDLTGAGRSHRRLV